MTRRILGRVLTVMLACGLVVFTTGAFGTFALFDCPCSPRPPRYISAPMETEKAADKSSAMDEATAPAK